MIKFCAFFKNSFIFAGIFYAIYFLKLYTYHHLTLKNKTKKSHLIYCLEEGKWTVVVHLAFVTAMFKEDVAPLHQHSLGSIKSESLLQLGTACFILIKLEFIHF